MKLLALSFLVFLTGLVNSRPKSFDGNLELSGITASPNTRPRIEPSYSRHSPASESRRAEGLDFCRKSAKCQTLNFTSCLGKELPYSQTTLELVGDSRNQDDVHVIQIRSPKIFSQNSKIFYHVSSLHFFNLGKASFVANIKNCSKMLGCDSALSMRIIHAQM